MQNDKPQKREDEGQPIGPKHTYEDRPGETRSTPDRSDRGGQSGLPQRSPTREPEGPDKPLPDYGDTEPGDPRRLRTSGEGGGGTIGPGDAGSGGASSTANA